MAQFEMELPTELVKQFKDLYKYSDKIFADMTLAGANVVLKNMKSNIPESFRDSEIMKCLKVTRSYRTSDGGINTKAGFYGYFINKNGKRTPAPLVVNMFEYGKSNFKKHPFVRKSVKTSEIEQAMLKVQNKALEDVIEGQMSIDDWFKEN